MARMSTRKRQRGVAEVILFSNGMVLAFDATGSQINELQGLYKNARRSILARAGVCTKFRGMDWDSGHTVGLTRQQFEDATIGAGSR